MENLLSQLGDFALRAGKGTLSGLANVATGGALSKLREEEERKMQLKSLGGILAGSQIPAFAFKEQSPEQIQQAKSLQLAELGTPEAVNLINQMVDTPEKALERKLYESKIGQEKNILNTRSKIFDYLNSNTVTPRPDEGFVGAMPKETAMNNADAIRKAALFAATSGDNEFAKILNDIAKTQAKATTGGLAPEKIAGIESGLRKEYTAQSKIFGDQVNAFNRIAASAQDPSGAGDISLIYSYMKMLDPTSVVREGEFATAQTAGSIPESIIAKYNQALKGERLTPQIRSDFVKRAGLLYDSANKQQQKTMQTFSNLATQTGVRPENVVFDLGATAERKVLEAGSGKLQNTGKTQDGKLIFKYNPQSSNKGFSISNAISGSK